MKDRDNRELESHMNVDSKIHISQFFDDLGRKY